MQAELDLTLGGIYQKLGKLARADSLLTARIAARAKRCTVPSTPMSPRRSSRSDHCASTKRGSTRPSA